MLHVFIISVLLYVYQQYSMLEQPTKSVQDQQKKQNQPPRLMPKGCYEIDQQQKYKSIKNFILIKDMYNIVCPFRFNVMGFVLVKKKDPNSGQIFQLFHQVSKRSILKAVPKSGQIGTKFVVMCSQTQKVVSRIRGDLMGSKFFIYDGGNNPSRKKFPSRKQLGYVYPNNNDFFSNKPPGLTAILAAHTKRLPDDIQIQQLGTLYQSEGILQLDQNTSQLLKSESQTLNSSPGKRSYTISSIQPTYCPVRKGFVMDLKGLISQPSQINMVMKTNNNQECLVMGKRGENSFYLFYGGPLTLLQAFGIFLVNYVTRKE